jgi:hypothetical protein
MALPVDIPGLMFGRQISSPHDRTWIVRPQRLLERFGRRALDGEGPRSVDEVLVG